MMAVQLARRLFTVADYYRMVEAGILDEDDRVELIEGEILEMSPIGDRHMACVDRLNRQFVLGLGEAAIVRVQGSVKLSDFSQPEPDLVLLRPRDDFYASGGATAEDVLLIVEVADSSIDYDRRVKAPLYARMRIPELWIVDLTRDHVAVSGDPTSDGFVTARVVRRGESISPAAFPDLTIAVDDILG